MELDEIINLIKLLIKIYVHMLKVVKKSYLNISTCKLNRNNLFECACHHRAVGREATKTASIT